MGLEVDGCKGAACGVRGVVADRRVGKEGEVRKGKGEGERDSVDGLICNGEVGVVGYTGTETGGLR